MPFVLDLSPCCSVMVLQGGLLFQLAAVYLPNARNSGQDRPRASWVHGNWGPSCCPLSQSALAGSRFRGSYVPRKGSSLQDCLVLNIPVSGSCEVVP